MMTLFTASPETDLDSRAENGKRSIADLIKAVSLWIAVCLLLPFPRRNGRYQVHLPDSSDLLKHCIKTSRNGDNSLVVKSGKCASAARENYNLWLSSAALSAIEKLRLLPFFIAPY